MYAHYTCIVNMCIVHLSNSNFPQLMFDVDLAELQLLIRNIDKQF